MFVGPAVSQTYTRLDIASILGFENNTQTGAFPAGWSGNTTIGIVTDTVSHSGHYSCRIDRTASSAGSFSTIGQSIPVDFVGTTIIWRGWIKMQDVNGYVALWAREDDAAGNTVQFATMQGENVGGTADWHAYNISIPLDTQAKNFSFGFFVAGAGTAWVDDLLILVDEVPVELAPQRLVTPLDTDHQFDNGSTVQFMSLSDIQVSNLFLLAKVWGFLKYHHPAITGGKHHWDYDLFRVMPQVLAASDAPAAQAAISVWIAGMEPAATCNPCVTLDTSGLALAPSLDWLSDTSLLGPDLSQMLLNIYSNRSAAATQFYVSLVPSIGNPTFAHELTYSTLKIPDSGFQLLALFRFWNMVQYFYPNRAIMSDDPANTAYWDQVLRDSIPRLSLAPDSFTYQQELIRFIARINDSHANLWTTLAARPPYGSCYLPADLQFVEGSPVVLRTTTLPGVPPTTLQAGDVIQQLDGAIISDLVAQWTPLYADSNQAARLRDMAEYLTRGDCGAASVVVDRGGQTMTLQPNRLSTDQIDSSRTTTHDLAGPAFQMLAPDIAYMKISTLTQAECPADIAAAAGTAGLIIDIRDYPGDFPLFALGNLLVTQPTTFVQFSDGDPKNPGAFGWAGTEQLTPASPHYNGKVVILVDEITQSDAEYHAMAFRAAGAVVVGSTTAGADGNVSTVPLPGGYSSRISGIGVFYPDHTSTQRVGIVPDVWVTPTIAGIRAGRDEVLEEGMQQIRAAHSIGGQSAGRSTSIKDR